MLLAEPSEPGELSEGPGPLEDGRREEEARLSVLVLALGVDSVGPPKRDGVLAPGVPGCAAMVVMLTDPDPRRLAAGRSGHFRGSRRRKSVSA